MNAAADQQLLDACMSRRHNPSWTHWILLPSWFMPQSNPQQLSHLEAAQGEKMDTFCTEETGDINCALCIYSMYSVSSWQKACVCVCVLSINTVLPPTPLSLWLRQQKWKVLIIFPFIQTINPGAQCSRVPLWETSHIWQRQWCYHHSLLITGAPVVHLYPEASTNTWTCVDTPIPFDTIWDYFFKAGTHFPKPAFVLNGILWAAFRSHFHHQ